MRGVDVCCPLTLSRSVSGTLCSVAGSRCDVMTRLRACLRQTRTSCQRETARHPRLRRTGPGVGVGELVRPAVPAHILATEAGSCRKAANSHLERSGRPSAGAGRCVEKPPGSGRRGRGARSGGAARGRGEGRAGGRHGPQQLPVRRALGRRPGPGPPRAGAAQLKRGTGRRPAARVSQAPQRAPRDVGTGGRWPRARSRGDGAPDQSDPCAPRAAKAPSADPAPGPC